MMFTAPHDFFDAEPPSGVRGPRSPRQTPLPPPGGKLSLDQLWMGLVSGQLRVCAPPRVMGATAAPLHELRVALVARSPKPLRAEHVELVAQYLRGKPSKGIAIDTGRSPPAASRQQARCLREMGFEGSPSRAPVLLALAAHAAKGILVEPASVGWRTEGLVPMFVLYGGRIDTRLEHLLSPQVLAALRLYIDGLTHHQIAIRLGKSQRTVTNQLCTATKKLRASSRFGIIARLVQLRQPLPR